MSTESASPEVKPTVITRTGCPPLRFKQAPDGYWSATSRDHNSTRWTNVRIYKTVGGKYIAEVESLTQWQGEQDYTKAESFDTPQQVIDYLKEGEERLGRVSQEAVSDACKADPAFAAAFIVDVE